MWTVRYGCAEWQDQEEYLSKSEATYRFSFLVKNPITLSAYPSEYIILENPEGETVGSFLVKGKS